MTRSLAGVNRSVGRSQRTGSKESEILEQLQNSYAMLRRYRDCAMIFDRIIALASEKAALKGQKAAALFDGNGDLASYRATLEALPTSIKDGDDFFSERLITAVYARDWRAAAEVINSNSNKDLPFFHTHWKVPRECLEIWLAHAQADEPAIKVRAESARGQLQQKIAAHSEEPGLLSILGLIDAFAGYKDQAIEQARRAVEMQPVSKDALDGPPLVENLARVYATTNERDLALGELAILTNTPNGVTYAELLLDPDWDCLRNDSRFNGLLAHLAPHP